MKTKSKKAKAESANYLDYVPMHNEDKYPFQTDDNGAVTITVSYTHLTLPTTPYV